MSRVRMQINYRDDFPEECNMIVYEDDRRLGEIRIQRSDLSRFASFRGGSAISIEQVVHLFPQRKYMECHAVNYDYAYVTKVEMRGAASRIFISADDSANRGAGEPAVKRILNILWNDDFSDRILWT